MSNKNYFSRIHKYALTAGELASLTLAMNQGYEVDVSEVETVVRTEKFDPSRGEQGEMTDRLIFFPPYPLTSQVGLYYCNKSGDTAFIERIIGCKVADLPLCPEQQVQRPEGSKGFNKWERKVKSRFLIAAHPGEQVGKKKSKRNIFMYVTKQERWYSDQIARNLRYAIKNNFPQPISMERQQQPRRTAPTPPETPIDKRGEPLFLEPRDQKVEAAMKAEAASLNTVNAEPLDVGTAPQWAIDATIKRMPEMGDGASKFINFLMKGAGITWTQLESVGDYESLQTLIGAVIMYKANTEKGMGKSLKLRKSVDELKKEYEAYKNGKTTPDPL